MSEKYNNINNNIKTNNISGDILQSSLINIIVYNKKDLDIPIRDYNNGDNDGTQAGDGIDDLW
jgi:hypothetical protein